MIFDNEEQCRKIITEYLINGLKNRKLVRYIVDVTAPEMVRSWLKEMGIELPEERGFGPFNIYKAEDFYCPGGLFNPPELIENIVPGFKESIKRGFRCGRICCEMSWALKGFSGSERLIEYVRILSEFCKFP